MGSSSTESISVTSGALTSPTFSLPTGQSSPQSSPKYRKEHMISDPGNNSLTPQSRSSDVLVRIEEEHSPRIIEVCVVFVKLGEIDTIREQFSADVLVNAKWREPVLDVCKSETQLSQAKIQGSCWDPKLFIENTIGECKEIITYHVSYNVHNEAYLCETRRIRGTFVENLELGDYPFDVQDLSVILASERYSTEIVFADDPTDLHRVCKRSFVDEQEWYLYRHIEVVKDEYSDDMVTGDGHPTKPMYVVRCRAARRPWYFLVNLYSFTFMIVGLSFSTFSVAWNKPENRLQLSFTLLLTSVAFKLVINQTMPKISYMTFLDQYTFTGTLVMVFICLWHAFSSLLPPDNAVMIQNQAFGLSVSLYVVYNIMHASYIYLNVYKKRRQMTKKDLEYVNKLQQAQDKCISLRSQHCIKQVISMDINFKKPRAKQAIDSDGSNIRQYVSQPPLPPFTERAGLY